MGGAVTLVAFIALGVMVRRGPEGWPRLVQAVFGADRPAAGAGATLSFEQLQAIRGVKPSFQIMLGENDINNYLEEHPEALGLPQGYAAPRVQFAPDQIVLSVRTRVLLWPVRVEVGMRPTVSEGRIKVEVTHVRAGRVSLPGEFRQQVQREMERLLAQQLEGAGVVPAAVQVEQGKLSVTVQLQPGP